MVRATLVLVMIVGSIILLWPATSGSSNNVTCSESMETCIEKVEKHTPSADMIWETLSRHFFSSLDISN
jgi:hypothetical protein